MRRMRRSLQSRWLPLALLLGTTGAGCVAQEIASLDLTQVAARARLRHPTEHNGVSTVGSRTGIVAFDGCHASADLQPVLRATLLSLDRGQYTAGDHPRFQVRIENIGSVPIKLPSSIDLAELQPADAGQKFTYLEMRVDLWIGGAQWTANTGGTVLLYGDDEHPDTMLTLQPGQSVRLTGMGWISLPGNEVSDPVSHVNASASLYNSETLLDATAAATVHHEVCRRELQGPSIPIAITASK
jgi:hypothetical protein